MNVHVSSLDVWTPTIQGEVRRALPAEWTLRFAASYDPAEQAALASAADVILAGWAQVTEAMMRAAPRLRMIQKWGVGVDRIDLDAARGLGIAVAVTAGGNAHPVAEHAIMLMLAVYRRLSLVDRAMREGRWLFAEMRERCLQIRHKTVGLVGFGNIGRAVARKLAGFEATILYADPVAASAEVERALGVTRVRLDELLARSDIVSLHLPGGGANRHLIDAAALARMRTGAVLVNTARGDIVDEAALVEALRSGALMGAGLDVYEPEPPEKGAALVGFDQVVLTPHTAGSVLDNVAAVARHAFGNIEKVLRGQALAAADLVVAPPAARAASEGKP